NLKIEEGVMTSVVPRALSITGKQNTEECVPWNDTSEPCRRLF
ncbi:hypothetical protein NPIL_268931, partial [Nephila pilipes]